MAGRASYSAQMPIVSGPEPAEATKAVGRSPTPPSTVNPPDASASAAQADDRSSSNANSGWAWMVCDSPTRASPTRPTSCWAAALALLNLYHHVPGSDRVARCHLDGLHRAGLLGEDLVLHLHGLEDADGLSRFHGVTLGHEHLDDCSLHGDAHTPAAGGAA